MPVRTDDGAAAGEEEGIRGDAVILEDREVVRNLIAAED